MRESYERVEIEGRTLIKLPALIDSHVHFRVPGAEHKEDWCSAARAAVRGGVTTVCDMPNNYPPCTTRKRLHEKKCQIAAQLQSVGIPLRAHLYLGADASHLDQIALVKDEVVALKIFMGCSTGGLVIADDATLEEAFYYAQQAGLLVAVHAEEESLLEAARLCYRGVSGYPALHSLLRPREAAIRATEKALALCAKYATPLYILHVSTREEVELIKQAKLSGVPVYAEAVTHHLFLTEEDYAQWGTFVQMNPPLRTREDQAALWQGIVEGIIDTIGTDHAPHTKEEKQLPFGQAPSGIPGIETLLPLLLHAVSEQRLTLTQCLALTRWNPQRLFSLPDHDDSVFVDVTLQRPVTTAQLATKCGWSPYAGRMLTGWPCYTVIDGQVFCASQGTSEGKRQLEDYLSAHRGGALATNL